MNAPSRRPWPVLACLSLLCGPGALPAMAADAAAKDNITWAVTHFPPFQIRMGAHQGTGSFDGLLQTMPRELVVRVKALLRRGATAAVPASPLQLDALQLRATWNGNQLAPEQELIDSVYGVGYRFEIANN